MPNHVTNMVLSSPEVISQLMNEKGCPDFKQVCPYPEKLEFGFRGINCLIDDVVRQACSTKGDVKDLAKQVADKYSIDPQTMKQLDAMVDNVQDAGFRHEMDWNIGIWATKWNAYEHDEDRSEEDRVVFDTAWSMPEGVLRELSANNVETPIVAMFADEDIGRNCGIFVFLGGNVIYDQQAEVDQWGVGKLQDRWNEFAIELKGYDYDDEDMQELRQLTVMHKIFRDKEPIGRLTPQARKLFGLDNQDEQSPMFLTTLFNSICKGNTGASIIYNSKGVTFYSTDYDGVSEHKGIQTGKIHEGEFVYVADNAVIELDPVAIAKVFEELSEEFSYTTDMKLLHLLQYCGVEGMNVARVLGVLVNFNSLVCSMKQPYVALNDPDDLKWITDWMDRNRSVDYNMELELFRQFIAGTVEFTTWADKANLPKPSLVPATIINASFPGMDDSRMGYEQCRVFKTMCMLYQYRDIITHNTISTEYMDSVDGKVYQVLHNGFKVLTADHSCIGLLDL